MCRVLSLNVIKKVLRKEYCAEASIRTCSPSLPQVPKALFDFDSFLLDSTLLRCEELQVGGWREGFLGKQKPSRKPVLIWMTLGNVSRESGQRSENRRINGLESNSRIPLKRPANQLAASCSVHAPSHILGVFCFVFSLCADFYLLL